MGDEARRLKELERENARLKAIVADQVLENRALKEIAEGNLLSPESSSLDAARRQTYARAQKR